MNDRVLIPEKAESLAKSDNTHRNAIICIVIVATIFVGIASSLFKSDALNNTLDQTDEEKVDLLFNKNPGQVAGAKTIQASPTPTTIPSTTPTPTLHPTPTTQPTIQPTIAPTNTPVPTNEPTQTPTPSPSPAPTVEMPTNTPTPQ